MNVLYLIVYFVACAMLTIALLPVLRPMTSVRAAGQAERAARLERLLGEIDVKLEAGVLTKDQAAALREALIDQMRPAPIIGRLSFGRAGAVLLAAVGVGLIIFTATQGRDSPAAARAPEADLLRASAVGAGKETEVLAKVRTYARTLAEHRETQMSEQRPTLPDVDTMIARLEARLANEPNDKEGWRMLGWSLFNTGKLEKAASAYARAHELAPDDVEIKAAFEDVKASLGGAPAQAAGSGNASPPTQR